jgi:hypothetical protein
MVIEALAIEQPKDYNMSSVSSVSSSPVACQLLPVDRKTDSDGDNDGSAKAPPVATHPSPAKLALSGSIGRNVNTVA